MSVLLSLCCCCCRDDTEDHGERQPLLHPNPAGGGGGGGGGGPPQQPESARRARPSAGHTADSQTAGRSGRLVMRLVGVADLDRRFSDVAETFNEQQDRYEAMERHIINLRQLYGCHHDNTLGLSEVLRNITEEHQSSHRVTLQLKGYDFCLNVVPLAPAPPEGEEGEGEQQRLPHLLKLAQDEVRGASRDAKMAVSAGTKLQELVGWLLRGEERAGQQVREAAPTHQERTRLEGNLAESLREARRARETALGYKQRAADVLTEVAHITGASL